MLWQCTFLSGACNSPQPCRTRHQTGFYGVYMEADVARFIILQSSESSRLLISVNSGGTFAMLEELESTITKQYQMFG